MTAERTYAPVGVPEVPQNDADALVAALHRLATAIEQQTFAILDTKVAPTTAPVLAPLPPVTTSVPPTSASFDGCPIHQTPWKVVPAGVSKKTGNAYAAFRACTVAGCDQRPGRI